MPEITASPTTSDTIAIIRACVRNATRQGMIVSTGPDLGVVHGATGWARDQRVPTLSPLGAVLLVHNPRKIAVPDEAVASVLGVSAVWVIGFDDAVSGQTPDASAIVAGPPVRLYGSGFRAGVEFRACHGVPAERSANEITAPIAAERPDAATLLEQLLAAIPLSEAIKALARGIPARNWPAGEAADAVEDLNDLATGYAIEGR